MSGEEYFPQVVVAAVDILGVKNLVAKGDQCQAAMDVLGQFVGNALARTLYSDAGCTQEAGALYKLAAYFGDAVYLFGDPTEEPAVQASKLLARVASLIGWGLCSKPRFLARAGIGIGDVRVMQLQTKDGPRELRIGSAMTRAYDLETSQLWVGGAVDADVPWPSGDGDTPWCIDYPIPLRRNCQSRSGPRAVNWVLDTIPRENVEQSLREASQQIGSTDDDAECVKKKIDNTLAFIKAICEAKKSIPCEVGEIARKPRQHGESDDSL